MGLKALDAPTPKSFFDAVHYLIISFSKYALFLAHLKNSSGLLETIAKTLLNVAGTRLGNAGTGALQLVASAVLDPSRRAEKVAVPSNLCCSQNLASSLNLTSSPSCSFAVTFSCHLPFTSSGLWLIPRWAIFCRFRSFNKFCQGQRSLGKGRQRNRDGLGCIRMTAASSEPVKELQPRSIATTACVIAP